MVQYNDIEILEQKAAGDLWAAETIIEKDDERLELIGFHLQQHAEKKMKADLQRHDIDYPKTHDLVTLLRLFPQKNISDEDEEFASILTRFAAESRYVDYFIPPFDGQQLIERTKKLTELTKTLWSD